MASASAAARLCILACRRAPRIQRIPRTNPIARQSPVAHRSFTTSTTRWAREGQQEGEEEVEDLTPIELKKMDAAFLESLTPEGMKQLNELAQENGFNSIDAYLEDAVENTPGWAFEDRALSDDLMKDDKGERPNKQSFWFDDEDPETNTEELDEFDEDDITSMAHGKLDEIREMRHYARLAVWELPLLSKLAKPFELPGYDDVLRWRYTTYMGESHPSEKKVVVQFHPKQIDLTQVQRDKLLKLAGPRYDPRTGIIKMSCESFEHPAQNKRHLSNQIDKLIEAAKDESDKFRDVPLDLRHAKRKPRHVFPRSWRLTPDRVLKLAEIRKHEALTDMKRAEANQLVDGLKMVEEYQMKKALEDEKKQKVSEMVTAPARGSGGSRARR